MTKKQKYVSPTCTVYGIETQNMLAASPTKIEVDNEKKDGVQGDVNSNEDFDIWGNKW